MADRLSFLHAIRECPGDRALRLVFADWLEEHDDPLGEFIRVQCELEPIRYDPESERAEQLRQRERELLGRHRKQWLGEAAVIEELAPPDDGRFDFRGGVAEAVDLPAQTLSRHGETLWRCCPAMHKMIVYEAKGQGAELARCPSLGRFREIELADWVSAEDARALTASPHLAEVETLTIWIGHDDEQEVCAAISSRGAFPGLREVRLVQHWGGHLAGHDAESLNRRADDLAALINRRRRRKALACVVRPFERLFPLNREVYPGIYAGRLPQGRKALAGVQYDGDYITMAILDEHGRMVEDQHHGMCGVLKRKPEHHWERYNEAEVLEYLGEKIGFELALIHAREFGTADGLAVYLYASTFAEVLESPDHVPDFVDEYDLATRGKDIVGWLEAGNFVVQFGKDCWADWRGTVHTT